MDTTVDLAKAGRNIVFDNKTAQSIEDKVERCDKLASKPNAMRSSLEAANDRRRVIAAAEELPRFTN
jgi:hypothetical protein